MLPFGLMTGLNAAHPLLDGVTGSGEPAKDGFPRFANELGGVLEQSKLDASDALGGELADQELAQEPSGAADLPSGDDVPLPDAGLVLGGSVPGHFGEAWKAGAGDAGAGNAESVNASAASRQSGVGSVSPDASGAQGGAGEAVPDGDVLGALSGQAGAGAAGEAEAGSLKQADVVADGRRADPAAGEDAGRRWQSALPPELRAAANQQLRGGVGTSAQKTVPASPEALGNEAAQPIGARAQEVAASGSRRIWQQAPGSIFSADGAANAAEAAGQPASGADGGVKPAAAPVQPLNAASAEAVAAAAQGRGTPSGLASQVDVAQAGVAADLDDAPLELDGDIDTSDRRAIGELRVAAPSQMNKAGAHSAGGQAAGMQVAGQQPVAAGPSQFVSQTMDPAADIILDDGNVPPAFENELALEPDFAATVRGGEMQGATRTEALQAPNQTQSSHVAAQVAVEMARNLKNAQTRFQMRFDPPELGRVDVNMKVAADGSVQAHLIVERPETLDMFLRDQRGLERALEAAGLNTNSNDLQFSLKQQGSDQQLAFGQDQSQQQNNSGEGADGTDGSGDEVAGADVADSQLVRMALAEQRGGLDISI